MLGAPGTRTLGFRERQQTEALILAHGLCQASNDFEKHISRAQLSFIYSIIFGTDPVASTDDPALLYIQRFARDIAMVTSPRAFCVEYFPWMQHLPKWMSPWRRWAEFRYKSDTKFFLEKYNDIRFKMVCFANSLLVQYFHTFVYRRLASNAHALPLASSMI
jgi:hypothetical protein